MSTDVRFVSLNPYNNPSGSIISFPCYRESQYALGKDFKCRCVFVMMRK